MRLRDAISHFLHGDPIVNVTVPSGIEVTIHPRLDEVGGKKAVTTGETNAYGDVEVLAEGQPDNEDWMFAPDNLITDSGTPLDETPLYREQPWWKFW